MEKAIVFDILGQFAHFRAFDTTRENISYPFPPRTAIIGVIAGIMGYPRNEYWENNPLSTAKISIQILNPIWRSKIRVNYLQTKYTMTLYSKLKIIMPQDPFEVKTKGQRGFYAPVNLNILRNVAYRIFFQCEDENVMKELQLRLKNHQYCYPPYLGHANMLAEVRFVGSFNLKKLESGIYEVDSVLPVKALDNEVLNMEDLGYSILFNVPVSLSYKNKKLVLKKTEHLIFKTKNEKIKAACKTDSIHSLEIDGEKLNIAFLGN
ncbi:MAG: type I-B CRISPR-associated protein Cas5b [Candidatus Heimdallarchaeaceae archaeon]